MSIWKWTLVALMFVVGGCGDDGGGGDAAMDTGGGADAGADTGGADTGGGDSGSSGGEDDACAVAASQATRACLEEVSVAWRSCFRDGGAPCTADDAAIGAALTTLQSQVEAECADGDFGLESVDAIVGRLQSRCRSEAASTAWRTYGGPQGAVWADADADARSCLLGAHEAATSFTRDALAVIGVCLTGGACDPVTVEEQRRVLADEAAAAVEVACGGALEGLTAVNPATYIARAAHQVDCVAAASFPDTAPLSLSCGPTYVDFEPVRGEYVRVTVDGDKWGTLCGDGSPYSFHVRLAPEGERLDRLIIGLQGGGVCAFEADCAPRLESAPGLFTAMDDEPGGDGIASNDPSESPFANWTKVYLPYCTQDVFAGGGVTETLGELELPRYGSVNMRAAVQMVRDVIWKQMDEEGGAGFRSDEVVALFGGWSAGAYGTLYNYHWFLDDLQWPRTAAFPDAGLALDNGEALGVRGLGLLKIPAWGMKPYLPPYCFEGDCALGPVIYEAISPRLKQVPEQQMLILTNPRDRTQQGDAFFGGEEMEARWINAVRQSFCDTRDLPGIQYFITSVADESVHVVSVRPELWEAEVAGETMRDWFWRAVTEPDTVMDRAEEGDFVAEVTGVEPYPCEVAP